MYKIVGLMIVFILSLSGCSDNMSGRTELYDRDLKVSFTLEDKSTKKEGMIKHMHVLVFDESGLFISRHKGIATSNGAGGEYIFRNITLSVNEAKRTLHFIANYDWSAFSDAAHLRKHESEVITKLCTTEGEVAYWQRIELEKGFETEAGGTLHLSQTVSLLRNIAQVAIVNKTNHNQESKVYLTDVSFAVCNDLDRGTVAPFDRINQTFEQVATEPSSFVINTNINESDFISAQNNEFGPLLAKSLYERINSAAKQNTFVILKGYYQATKESINTTTPSYYKLDICVNGASSLLDITRNTCYKITLHGVASEGYSSLSEAIAGASNNNINASIASSEILQVSDGNTILTVDNTLLTFTETGIGFSVGYVCYDIKTGKVDNSGVIVTLEQDANYPVVAGTVNSSISGIVTGITASNLPVNDIYQATITISKGTLSRKVRLRLRSPMSFGNVITDPADGYVDKKTGAPVSISFTFPADLEQEQFPIPVYLYTKGLSPKVQGGNNDGNLSIDSTPDGSYRYIYMAPYKGFDAMNNPIIHTIHLQTIFSYISETVVLDSDLFQKEVIYIRNR
ncbi:MAG: fimbrial protein [Tannerellaceae bacterium]